MNPRIRELAEQAGITTNLDTDYFEQDPNKWVDYFAEKFAELIVQECAKAADQGLAEITMQGPKWPSYYIKKHFGVES